MLTMLRHGDEKTPKEKYLLVLEGAFVDVELSTEEIQKHLFNFFSIPLAALRPILGKTEPLTSVVGFDNSMLDDADQQSAFRRACKNELEKTS